MDRSEYFRATFAETYQPVLAYALRRTRTPEDADEVVSEVFTVAWRRLDDLKAAQTPLAWLFGVALNVVRNRRRSEERHLRLVGRAEASARTRRGVTEPSEAVEIRAALATLPDDDAELLRLVAWEGLSHGEAAAVLGCSSNAIGIRLHRARQRLDAALGRNRPHSPNRPGNQRYSS